MNAQRLARAAARSLNQVVAVVDDATKSLFSRRGRYTPWAVLSNRLQSLGIRWLVEVDDGAISSGAQYPRVVAIHDAGHDEVVFGAIRTDIRARDRARSEDLTRVAARGRNRYSNRPAIRCSRIGKKFPGHRAPSWSPNLNGPAVGTRSDSSPRKNRASLPKGDGRKRSE
jgi:hypothetical protein